MTTRAEILARAKALDLYEAARHLRERDEDQRRQARFTAADQLDRPRFTAADQLDRPRSDATDRWTYITSPACWTYGSFA